MKEILMWVWFTVFIKQKSFLPLVDVILQQKITLEMRIYFKFYLKSFFNIPLG